MKDNTNQPFYIGQKVVCVDDSAGRISKKKALEKDKIYTVLDILNPNGGTGRWEIKVLSGYMFWDCDRFAPIQTERIRYVAVAEELKNVPQVAETIDN